MVLKPLCVGWREAIHFIGLFKSQRDERCIGVDIYQTQAPTVRKRVELSSSRWDNLFELTPMISFPISGGTQRLRNIMDMFIKRLEGEAPDQCPNLSFKQPKKTSKHRRYKDRVIPKSRKIGHNRAQ